MIAFDKYMNLVLADAQEVRKIADSNSLSLSLMLCVDRSERRTLGLIILRGETIVSLSVDGPPPVSASDKKVKCGAYTYH
jgi:small nuclear ribonucleoprotein B and B'